MEYQFRLSRRWIQKMVVFIGFSLFTARAQAQIGLPLPPTIAPQPVGLSVQNGGTAVLVSDASSLSVITNVSWYHNNGQLVPANQVVTVNAGLTAVSTLTIPNVSSTNAGNYYMVVQNSFGLSATSSKANVIVLLSTVTNVLQAVTGASKMLTQGFKLQFSAPIGSNVVIEATSDMTHWSSIYTNVASSGSVTYTDAVARTISSRFYRARLK